MEIKLSQSEIVSIIKKHLEAQNISSGEVSLQTIGSQVQAIVFDAEGKAQQTPPKPASNPFHGNRIFPGVDGGHDWNKQVQTSTVFTDDLAETLGQVFTSFNETVDSLKNQNKKDIDLEKIKDMFKPRDSK